MRITKRLLRSEPVRDALAFLAWAYVRFVERTTRWTVDDTRLRQLVDQDRGGIAAFWHGRLMMLHRAWTPRPRPFHIMISQHRDGTFIAKAIERMNVHAIGADRKTGSMSAMRGLKRLIDRGAWIGITPDGPKGPRMRARGGAIKLAQLTGRPVLPVSIGLSRRRVIQSWDRFCLPLPFGRGEIRYGRPIEVPRDADPRTLERCRQELEHELNRLSAELDRRFGQTPIEPASAPAPERLDSTAAPDTAPTGAAPTDAATAGRSA